MTLPLGFPCCTRAILLSIALAVLSAPTLAAGPFQGFAGDWKGSGTVTTSSGQEAIRCRARYTTSGDGSDLAIDVSCASDSYRVNILSSVAVRGNTLTGSWQETTRGVSGDVSGRMQEPNTFQASLQTVGGGFQLGARTNGRQQAITITSQGGDIQGANIVLKRR